MSSQAVFKTPGPGPNRPRLGAPSVALALAVALTAAAPAQAQEVVDLFAGCWLPEGAGGDRLALDPGGGYRMGGDIGRWSATSGTLTLQPSRSRWEEWDLSLVDGVLTLSSPRERRQEGRETVETPPDPSVQRSFHRAPYAECDLRSDRSAGRRPEPPASFVPAPDGVVLTNLHRNDPVELRPSPTGDPLVCQIIEGVCQPVAGDGPVFEATQPALVPGSSGSPSAGTIRIWAVRQGDSAPVRLDGQPCVATAEAPCPASDGFVALVLGPDGAFVTGLVDLATVRPPEVETAFVTPPAADAPAQLWIETGHHRVREGEFRWQAWTVTRSDEGVQMTSVAGPFTTGAEETEATAPPASSGFSRCLQVRRGTPEVDPSDGRVQLTADVSVGQEEARRIELVWAPDIERYQAATSVPGPAPPLERVCE